MSRSSPHVVKTYLRVGEGSAMVVVFWWRTSTHKTFQCNATHVKVKFIFLVNPHTTDSPARARLNSTTSVKGAIYHIYHKWINNEYYKSHFRWFNKWNGWHFRFTQISLSLYSVAKPYAGSRRPLYLLDFQGKAELMLTAIYVNTARYKCVPNK